jgi:hypothetical protein
LCSFIFSPSLDGIGCVVEPLGFGEGAIDQRLRHVVPGDDEKSNLGQRVVHLACRCGQRTRRSA